MTEPTRLVTKKEAAAYAGRQVITIERWVKAGRLTAYRSKAPAGPNQPSVRIDLDEIDDLVKPVAS